MSLFLGGEQLTQDRETCYGPSVCIPLPIDTDTHPLLLTTDGTESHMSYNFCLARIEVSTETCVILLYVYVHPPVLLLLPAFHSLMYTMTLPTT
jgi:hypothetical protein